ncbi:MFS transporter [Sulfobacillus thermosulfidooxidans]|uniref:MFS transporter n=1 Tax=Sulfobacillus thermosulfidooxidans TaxID=28034 RepID=UPI0006B425C2|nr:MFS transporter [Sulfobacillus thermosulfidooxidans]
MTNSRQVIFIFSLISIFVATYNLTLTSGLLHHFREVWHLEPATLSLINAAPLLGMAGGGLVLGLLSDRVGRVTILQWNWLIILLSSAAALVLYSPSTIIGARILLGIGLGSDFAIVFPYIVELGNTSRMVIAVLGLGDVGQWLAYAIDALSRHLHWYRMPFALSLLWGIPLALWRHQLPESRVWQQQRVTSYTQWARSLITPSTRTHIIQTGVPWALHQISGQGLALFLPSILLKVMATTVHWGSSIIKLLVLPAFIVALQIVPLIGPVKWQIIGFCLRALSFVAAVVTLLVHGSPWLTIVMLTSALFWGSAGPDKTTVLIPALLFGPRIHTSGQGMAELMGRLGSLVGVLIFGSLAITGHTVTALSGFALTDFLGAVVSLSLLTTQFPTVFIRRQKLHTSSLSQD